MRKSTIWALVLVIVVILIIIFAWKTKPAVTAPATTTSTNTTVAYSCDAGKTITANYSDSTVALSLSDGRTLTLPQTVSGSGIRYESGANTANDIVFSSEGNNAFLTENGTTTFNNCVGGTTTAPAGGTTTTGMSTFTDQSNTFSFMYPADVTVAGGGVGYTQQWSMLSSDQSSGMVLAKGTIDQSTQPKTNFAGATFMVGTSADAGAVASCTVASNGATAAGTVTINGVTYTKMTFNDAGAGNFYDTTAYRTVRNSQCYSIEYTIHSTNLGNYDPSQGISAFDQTKVTNELEQIAQSFKFL